MSTDIDDCIAINHAGGLDLLEWEVGVLADWLGRDKRRRWAAMSCGLSVPRQNGKSLGIVVPRSTYGMVALGERVIYTAHLQKTATETFEAMASFFETGSMSKFLDGKRGIKTALGREEINLKRGPDGKAGRIKFLARTRNGGRGQHGDLLIFDEAQELDEKQQASFKFALAASRCPQTAYVGTPPDEEAYGYVFERIRNRALDGSAKGTAWSEWSTDEVGDVDDETRWAATNPSYGILINHDTVADEAETQDPVGFARERLGYWQPRDDTSTAIDAADWLDATGDRPASGRTAFGVRFAPDGSSVAVVGAKRPESGPVYVELLDYRPGHGSTEYLADLIDSKRDRVSAVIVDGISGAGELVQRLGEKRFPPRRLQQARTAQVIDANARFLEALRGGNIEHPEGEVLDESACGAKRRAIGNAGAWGFASTAKVDATPIEAAALAYLAVMGAKSDPSRKARIG